MKIVKIVCERTYNISEVEFYKKTKGERKNFNNTIKHLAENPVKKTEFGTDVNAYSEIQENHENMFPDYLFFAKVEMERNEEIVVIGFCDNLENLYYDIERIAVNKEIKEKVC